MAKKKDEPMSQKPEPPDATNVLVELEISSELPLKEFCLHIDTRLTPQQSTILRRLASQLDKKQARLGNARRVTHPTDALKYLLEQIGNSL